ncbi:MAG TPA: hypothetical protein G4O02_18830 [Caldilineae bacterium]|nr:hypothetical protein [Caldilineae bacterium]
MRSSYPAYTVLAALVIGLLIGWLVIGWWLWPVKWTDVLPGDLAPQYRNMYVIGVAHAWKANGNLSQARQALEGLGPPERQSQILAEALKHAPPEDARALMELQKELSLPMPSQRPGGEEAGAPPRTLLIAVIIVIIVGLVGVGGWAIYDRIRQGGPFVFLGVDLQAAWRRLRTLSIQLPAPAKAPRDELESEERPLATFTPVFRRGAPDYIENYHLRMPDGNEVLGECGMGVAEILRGDDTQVTALEVWLFDKKDIRTQAYVLMSEHAHEDTILRDRLSLRGRLILAEPGRTFTIESQTMRLRGEIVSVAYADGEGPPHSVFDEVKVHLEVYPKGRGR